MRQIPESFFDEIEVGDSQADPFTGSSATVELGVDLKSVWHAGAHVTRRYQ